MDEFKWGIIGPGNIAGSFIHDMKFCTSAKHSAVAVLHHNIEKAEEFGTKHRIAACYDSIEKFLEEIKVDAVYIATPHTLHFEQTINCLKKRIPVLCEKPMGINKKQVEEMIQTAGENETFLMEGMWVRFLPSLAKVSEIIKKGTIGKVTAIKATLSFKAPYDDNNRYFNPELGGGSLLDLGIYPVFLSLYILGKPQKIKAVAQLSENNIDEDCKVICDYVGGANSFLESSLITQTENQAIIYGEYGNIIIPKPWNEKPPEIKIEFKDGNWISYPCEWHGEGFHYEMNEVYKCIYNRKTESEKMNSRMSLDMIEMMDSIREQTGIEYPKEEILKAKG